ncbi:hypothetical protein [Staphylococcus saprophyticus]|nr:hypothetical protein [Staphylococcus saprophyticus]
MFGDVNEDELKVIVEEEFVEKVDYLDVERGNRDCLMYVGVSK